MELTSCACVCVPVACETPLRLFDFVFPCVRVAVPPYIGFTVGMVVSRCCCIDLDPVTLEGCCVLCAAYFSACISPSFVVPVRFGCVETAVSKKCSFFLGVCVCFCWCVVLWVFRSWLRSAILFGCNFGCGLLEHRSFKWCACGFAQQLACEEWPSFVLQDASGPTDSATSLHELVT